MQFVLIFQGERVHCYVNHTVPKVLKTRSFILLSLSKKILNVWYKLAVSYNTHFPPTYIFRSGALSGLMVDLFQISLGGVFLYF